MSEIFKENQSIIREGKSFKEIGKILGNDCTTISKEVRRHRVERKTGAFSQSYNACKYRIGCHKRSLCKKSGVCEKGSVAYADCAMTSVMLS